MMRNRIFLTLLFCSIAHLALALPEDAKQKIVILSDKELLSEDEEQNKTIYIHEGSVLITHGTLKLAADKVTATKSDQGRTIECIGSPVSFQVETIDHGLLKGHAKSIHYDVDNGKVEMLEDIELFGEDGTYKSAKKLVFDLNTEDWTAQGSQEERSRTEWPAPADKNKKEKEILDGDS